jgi:putative transcriptional regulator
MMNDDLIEFDDVLTVALAHAAAGPPLRADLKRQLLARLQEPEVPAGFAFRSGNEADWLPHPVPGIKMKVLAMNRKKNYATLLLDVAPGTRFPEHYHTGAEECYVLSGSLHTCGRKMAAGDFLHADADTPHGELYTEEGCQVLLIVEPEDYMPDPIVARQ